jgi:hypothetical protein
MPGQNDQHEEIIDINLEDVSAEEEIISPQTSSSISMRNSALFILKLKEIHKVSQSAVNDIIQEITAFTQQGIEEIKFKLFSTLSDMPNPGVDEIFLNSLLNDPFIGLTSEYLQNKYFEENLKLVVPVKRSLGTSLKKFKRKSEIVWKNKHDYVYDVDLLQSLSQLLHNETILNEVLQGHSRRDN